MTQPESAPMRALRQIGTQKYSEDFVQHISELDQGVEYLSKYLVVMQKGIDDANKNIIQKIQDFINEVVTLFSGGVSGDTGMDLSQIGVVIDNFSAILGIPDFTTLLDPLGWAQDFFDIVLDNPVFNAIKDIIDIFFGAIIDGLDFITGGLASEFFDVSSFTNAINATHSTATTAQDTADTAAAQAAAASDAIFTLSEVAVTSITTPIWASTGGLDIVTFPHYSIPIADVPSGAIYGNYPGNKILYLYYIRSDRAADFTRFKAIFGKPATAPTSTILGVYGVDPNTNDFSKVWDSGNLEGSFPTDTQFEKGFNMGTVISPQPGHLLAAAILEQFTASNSRPHAAISQPPVTQPGIWPPGVGAYITNQTTLPSSFNMSATTTINSLIGWFGLSQ